jgi:hypothetical protein
MNDAGLELLQIGVLIVVQVQRKDLLEDGRLDEREHDGTIRLWRTKGKIGISKPAGYSGRGPNE